VRIVSVVGTRPQLIKAAALLPALRARHEEVFVDTGQHYDEAMAGTFFEELDLPPPDRALGVGGGTQAEQVARMLVGLEPILLAEPVNQPAKWLAKPQGSATPVFLEALKNFMYWENYDVRVRMDGKIDRVVLEDILRKRKR